MNSRWPWRILFILLLLIPLELGAADIALQKGPFLAIVENKVQVRCQARGLNKPELEWRKIGQDKETKVPMKSDTYNFWRADLDPTAEEYRIVAGDDATPWFVLLIPQKPRAKDTFLFAAYGDNRTGGGSSQVHKELIKQIKNEYPNFVIHTGDLTVRGSSDTLWDQFFSEGLPLYSTVPFQPAIGNHDLSSIRLFAHYFDLGKDDATYYYYQYGKAHFFALDSTLKFTPNSDQYKFFTSKLESIKGQWPIIVYFHHAANSFSRHGSDSKVQKVLVPLFEKYGVTLVVNGHDHGYQRFEPIHGVQYIVTGGGGAPLYGISPKAPLVFNKEIYNYVLFEVGDKYIRGTMKSSGGVVEDQFEILAPGVSAAETTPTKTPPSKKDLSGKSKKVHDDLQ